MLVPKDLVLFSCVEFSPDSILCSFSEGFEKNKPTRPINPAKPEIGKISKHIDLADSSLVQLCHVT